MPPINRLFSYTTLFRSPTAAGRRSTNTPSFWTCSGGRARLTGRCGNCTIWTIRATATCRAEEQTSELQKHIDLVCCLRLEKKKQRNEAGKLWRGTCRPI